MLTTLIQIARYLMHFHGLSAWKAYDGQMCGIDLAGMTLTCRGKDYRVKFKPPMTSYHEARYRVIQLDQEAKLGLNESDITVTEFLPPTGWYAFPFAIIAATFLGYSRRWWFADGEIVERYLGSGFAKFSWAIQPYLIAGMLLIHLAELQYFMRRKLPRHSINPRQSLYWKWAATTFIEGQFAFKRFDKLVEEKREEKAKQKH